MKVKEAELVANNDEGIIVSSVKVAAFEESKGCTVCGVDGAGY